jgi:hypothetical protein
MQRYPELILTDGSSVKWLTIDYRGHVMHLTPNQIVPQFPNVIEATAWEQQAIQWKT